ncbi:MAG TPA: hypothetical protein PLE43_06635 [Alphaproteobacteria bacterium]|nr:hypothetical protein [Alphaproteobacteria bacterium]
MFWSVIFLFFLQIVHSFSLFIEKTQKELAYFFSYPYKGAAKSNNITKGKKMSLQMQFGSVVNTSEIRVLARKISRDGVDALSPEDREFHNSLPQQHRAMLQAMLMPSSL